MSWRRWSFGFLLGSIPFGLLLTRAAGLGDIRSIGSGNIGATNVLRTGNKKLAAAVLLLDALKGCGAGGDRVVLRADRARRGGAGRRARPHVHAVARLQGRQGRGDDARRDVGPVVAVGRARLRAVAAVRLPVPLFVARRAALRSRRRRRVLVAARSARGRRRDACWSRWSSSAITRTSGGFSPGRNRRSGRKPPPPQVTTAARRSARSSSSSRPCLRSAASIRPGCARGSPRPRRSRS